MMMNIWMENLFQEYKKEEQKSYQWKKVKIQIIQFFNYYLASSVFSAANAVKDHLRDWFNGVDNKLISMGVVSKG